MRLRSARSPTMRMWRDEPASTVLTCSEPSAPPRYSRALRAYNDSGLYVDAVTRYAREIAANPYGVYYLYLWRP